MAHLAVVSTRSLSQRKSIPFAVKQRIWAMPCAVCGIPYGIKVDHIVPASCGGDNAESNLQPLCHNCNHAKHNRLSNRELTRKILGNGVEHFLSSAYRWANRYAGFDGCGRSAFSERYPEHYRHALALHAAFLDRVARC